MNYQSQIRLCNWEATKIYAFQFYWDFEMPKGYKKWVSLFFQPMAIKNRHLKLFFYRTHNKNK